MRRRLEQSLECADLSGAFTAEPWCGDCKKTNRSTQGAIGACGRCAAGQATLAAAVGAAGIGRCPAVRHVIDERHRRAG